MKKLLIAFCISHAISVYCQPTSLVGSQSHAIMRTVNTYHYSPPEFNDSFSLDVFDGFISSLDGGGFYFLQADIQRFEKHKYQIDDQIKSKTSSFFDEVIAVYKIRLLAADSLLNLLENEKPDYSLNEVLSYKPEDYPDYVTSLSELKERWRKWLKYSTLDELFNGDYYENPLEETNESLLSKIHIARKDAFDYEKYEIKSFLENPSGYENYLSVYYLDVIALTCDPHTSFFSARDRDEFVEELSEENKMFGFSVEEDEKGIVRISYLMPGSPAWNCNKLNKGDELVSITFSDGKHLDMATSTMDDLTLLFGNTRSTELSMVVKKGNGEEITVELVKGEVYLADDAIQNFVLKGEHQIGYITLPDFYTNWDGDGGLGCANDVARAVIKLQKENIEGLILDLRNNGGGSLKEAIDLAGIFIDWGPLCINRDHKGEMISIKDMNKGAIYTGPLVILVNSLSASASEILTAALQDYNRAIVIGSPTYGKATSQVILPLDPDYIYGVTDPDKADDEFGYLKITISSFYRVTNQTHQGVGVIPNILMPDYYDLYDFKEASYSNYIQPDSIVKKVYFTPMPNFSADLFQKSEVRTHANAAVQRMYFLIDSMLTTDDQYELVPLSLNEYRKFEKTYADLLTELIDLTSTSKNSFIPGNNQYDQAILDIDAFRREINSEMIKQLETDLYVGEAYNVLCDYLNLK